MLLETLQGAIFCLGIITAIIEFALGVYFVRTENHFARAFAAMCFADCVTSIVTTLFSMSSVLGLYGDISPEIVVIMRLSIFVPLLVSSAYLWWKVRTA